jgi:hypothetical protein
MAMDRATMLSVQRQVSCHEQQEVSVGRSDRQQSRNFDFDWC